ncbi:MAG TPA: S9 family peptidase [Thermoanaerobaculia bacterium]|nr:S9 family peptidase [Thermoanaerobaculia bacterium]
MTLPLLAADVPAPAPPMANKNPKMTDIHGDRIEDDYYWLRERSNPEVRAYLEAENKYADEIMKGTEALQEKLYQEMLGRIKQTDLTVPYRMRGYSYYTRTETGKQYSIYCRKKGSLDAPEQVLLDLNEMARDQRFMALGDWDVSDDGNYLAFTTDNTGFRDYRMQIKDLGTGTILPESVEKVSSVAWAADGKTLFYARDDAAKRPYRIYRHARGADPSGDVLVYEEKDERFRVGVRRSASRAYLLLASESHTAGEWRTLPAGQPTGEWKLVAPREAEHEYDVDHRGDLFYIRTNSGGCRNFRLVTAPVSNPGRQNWKELIPCRENVMISGFELFSDHMTVMEREDGLQQIRITDFGSGQSHRVAFPEPVYSVYPSNNNEFETSTFRYSYQSLTTPPTIYDYDLETRQSKLLKRTEVLGGYDPDRYQSERRYATASDGTKIPMSLVYRKGLVKDGKNPALLYGYGSYGASSFPTFNSNRVTLLDRGFVYAIAHIRGGGELGKKWHDQGRMMSKKNTFTDFIACAEALIADGYTSKERLVAEGGSAGGLLMGAVVNLRPDLFKAIVNHVPFVDVINTMLDESLPLTVGEFEEWGNPKIPEQYAYMKSYSPYDNIAAKDYPTMLVKTSFDDSQVMYWEPAKYVAKLRATKTDKNPLIFKINMAGGHGGASGRYDRIREAAFDDAFIFTALGIAP